MANKNNYPPKPQEFPRVIQEKEGKLNAYIFDIDGTLAYMNGRSPYDFTRVGEDGVYEDVKEILDELRFSGAGDPLAALVLCGAHAADRVMVAGEWKVEDTLPVNMDVAELRREHGAAAKAFLDTL